MDIYTCYICNKHIHEGEPCSFTGEFDAFVCEDCETLLIDTPYRDLNPELQMIKHELTGKPYPKERG